MAKHARKDPAQVLHRQFSPQSLGGQTLLATIRDGQGPVFRAFFGTGTDLAELPVAGPKAGTQNTAIEEVRAVSGSVLLVASSADPRPKIALPTGPASLAPLADERALFAGLNAIFGFRLGEDATSVADWLSYHVQHHGLQAALIVDRAAPAEGAPPFAQALDEAVQSRGIGGIQVVVVRSDAPLGRPGMAAENSLWLAPDAPGRDRMTAPPDDPWLAPLGQELLPELMKWWFLADARAVLQIDVCDLLAMSGQGEPNAFDRALRAPRGVITLEGRRAYPWRLRDENTPTFGDHICAMADRRDAILRWGVAPAIAGLQNTWRLSRIAYAKPDPGPAVPFWRAMALRIPGQPSAALVPKSSLAELSELVALATRTLAHKPARMPEAKKKPIASQRSCIVTTMKNEGPFVLEWLAYHRAIGVEDVLVYTNDCTDGTDTMLALLQKKGLVQHRINPWNPAGTLKPQHAALLAAEDEPVVQNAGWIICMDVDEFLNIKLGDGRLSTLYAAMEAAHPGANMISATWRLFGNGDVHEYADRFVTDQFTHCAEELVRKPHQAWGFKTLFRNLEVYKKIGVHRPKGLSPSLRDEVRWLNGSGRTMPVKMLRNGWRSSVDTYGYDWVQLNHYAVRSAESFLVKRDRGRVNHTERDQGLAYWFRMNHNAVEDRSIQSRRGLLLAEWEKLMADPEIRAAHEYSVACHRAKIAELHQVAAYGSFYADLTGPRMESLSRRLKHFGTAVFAAGPSVVPDDIALAPDLPADFFFTVTPPADAVHD